MSANAKLGEDNLTLHEERFCQRFFIHGNATLAHREVYVNDHTKGARRVDAARRVLHQPACQAYIAKLRAQMQMRVPYTKQKYLDQCQDAYLLAKRNLDPKGMVAAATAMAKAEGLIIERRQDVPKSIRDLSDEELLAQADDIERQLAELRAAGNKEGAAPARTRKARPARTAKQSPALH